MNKIAKLGCATLTVFVVASLALSFFFARAGTTSTRLPDRSDACFMSQKFVKDSLSTPSTAEFPDWIEANCRVTQSGNIWKVRSFVDAQNSYGAMIRSDYGVEMSYNTERDTWILLDVQVVER